MPDQMGKPVAEVTIDDGASIEDIADLIEKLREKYHVEPEWSKGRIQVGKPVNKTLDSEVKS